MKRTMIVFALVVVAIATYKALRTGEVIRLLGRSKPNLSEEELLKKANYYAGV